MANHRIELRGFTLNMNMDDLHKNREMPAGFPAYLGVVDGTLPLAGTAHRRVRGDKDLDAAVKVNSLRGRFSHFAVSPGSA